MTLPLLSLLIWLPIIGGSSLLLFKKESLAGWVRGFALLIALPCLGLSAYMLHAFDPTRWQMQFQETHTWIPNLNIYYALGIDGFSAPLIALSCFMTLLVILASYRSVKVRVAEYLAAFLIMQGLMCGVFSALDAVLFYSFWEAMLIPMFLIIGIWGGANRLYATMKFFLYTFLGSVLLLVVIIYLQILARQTPGIDPSATFNILTYHQLSLSLIAQKWVFLGLLIAFAVKVPMWPVHTWLPDAHVEAPTGGSVILAAILLKMGGYGFIRFILPIVPNASQAFASGMVSLSLIAIVYIAMIAIVQKDMKKLIAYSSISHMGVVTLGFFTVFSIVQRSGSESGAVMSLQGAMVQMISHGLVSAALFFSIGILYDRLHTRLVNDYGGVAHVMPVFATFFMLFVLANIGMPGTAGFVGEFLIIVSAFKANIWYAAGAATILILGASYTLWMYKQVIFGAVFQPRISALKDIQGTEIVLLLLLAIPILTLGFWPAPLLEMFKASSEHLVGQILQSKI